VKRKVKRNISFMLATSLMVTATAGSTAFAANDGVYSVENKVSILADDTVSTPQSLNVNVEDKTEYKLGEEFVVDFNLTGNLGINSYTLYIDYDPSVIQAVDVVPAENTEDYINYESVNESTGEVVKKNLYNLGKFKGQLNLKPNDKNEDYLGLEADGTKTAAELGRIKYAFAIDDYDKDNILINATGNGTLFKMKFKVVGKGESKIEVKPVGDGFSSRPSDYSKLETKYGSASVSGVEALPSEKAQVLRIDASKEEVPAGEEFTVDFKLNNNPGINSYNMHIEYDPSIIQALGVEKPEGEYVNCNGKPLFDEATLNKLASEADGSIMYAYDIKDVDENNNLAEATNDGTLFKIKFKALKEGTSNVSVKEDGTYGEQIFAASPANTMITKINTNVKKASVLVVGTETTDEITFKDKDFENEIKDILGKSVINKTDAEAVEKLEIEGKDISSISDLKYFPNIKTLKLKENAIKSISAISGLSKVEIIDLSDNVIRDISELSGLKNIKELDISDNRVKSLKGLESLSSITTFKASSNYIDSLVGIEGLTSVTNLDLSENDITDISNLATLTSITDLDLSENDITDISSLASLTKLVNLDLSETEVKDISVLKELKNLKYVNLKDTNVKGDEAAEKIITELKESGVDVDSDVTYIAVSSSTIKNIVVDILKGLGISIGADGEIPKKEAKNVTTLPLENKGLEDIKDLENFTEVKDIDLSGNNIKDISVIKNMKKLKRVNLRNNNVKDISIFEKFINKDVSLMSEDEGLESVDLRGNPIFANNVKATKNVINNLIANGIEVKYDEYKPEDIDGNNKIEKADAESLLRYVLQPDAVENSKAIKERQEDLELTFKDENIIVANDAAQILKNLDNK